MDCTGRLVLYLYRIGRTEQIYFKKFKSSTTIYNNPSMLNRTVQHSRLHNTVVYGKVSQSRVEQSRVEQSRIEQNTIFYCILLSTVLYSTVRYGTWYGTGQNETIGMKSFEYYDLCFSARWFDFFKLKKKNNYIFKYFELLLYVAIGCNTKMYGKYMI